MCGIKELSEMLARKRGISKKEATSIMTDAVDVLCDAIVGDGGVSVRGLFTIKQKVRPARSGNVNGHAWESPDKRVLTIKIGNELDKELNPEHPA